MAALNSPLPPACYRRDYVLAAYVDAAVVLLNRISLKKTEEFAVNKGIPEHVIVRALIASGPRRPRRPTKYEPNRNALIEAYYIAPSITVFKAFTEFTPWIDRRTDKRKALLIDAAINAAASHGFVGAAAELIAQEVSTDVVFRALCKQFLRRRYFLEISPQQYVAPSDQVPICRRRNYVHAAYVNAALTISKLSNLQRAENVLAQAEVSKSVIARILYLNGMHRTRVE